MSAKLTEAQRREIDHAMLESLSTWFEMRAKGYAGSHSFNDWDVAFMLARVAIQIAPTAGRAALEQEGR
jgi:hypothetical protein